MLRECLLAARPDLTGFYAPKTPPHHAASLPLNQNSMMQMLCKLIQSQQYILQLLFSVYSPQIKSNRPRPKYTIRLIDKQPTIVTASIKHKLKRKNARPRRPKCSSNPTPQNSASSLPSSSTVTSSAPATTATVIHRRSPHSCLSRNPNTCTQSKAIQNSATLTSPSTVTNANNSTYHSTSFSRPTSLTPAKGSRTISALPSTTNTTNLYTTSPSNLNCKTTIYTSECDNYSDDERSDDFPSPSSIEEISFQFLERRDRARMCNPKQQRHHNINAQTVQSAGVSRRFPSLKPFSRRGGDVGGGGRGKPAARPRSAALQTQSQRNPRMSLPDPQVGPMTRPK